MNSVTSTKLRLGESRDTSTPARQIRWTLAPTFFVSGAAALFYQVCWQKLLFASFGVDLDSITIIVSVFMLGLGIGALIGGQLADRFPERAIELFAASELVIGMFGLASPHLIAWAGDRFVARSGLTVATANFLLLLLPTTMMGATLPILVAHVTRHWGNVGESIGMLYFVNTLGAATGTALVGFLWFWFFELNTAIYTAALANLCVAAVVAIVLKRKTSHV
jgi:predicted membrane-bound spermidine synthase